MKLTIAKLQRDRFGPRSERTARLLDQMELQLEELEANVSEDDLAAGQATERAAAGCGGISMRAFLSSACMTTLSNLILAGNVAGLRSSWILSID
jgi:hypothetical protein